MFIDIKLTVKEFKGKDNILYSVIAYEQIKKADIVTQTATENSGLYYAPSASTISLEDIFRNVNKEDSLYQYIPPQFFEDSRYNKEKSRLLSNTPGVQFPNNIPRVDFNKNIQKFKQKVNGKDTSGSVTRFSLKRPVEETPFSGDDNTVFEEDMLNAEDTVVLENVYNVDKINK